MIGNFIFVVLLASLVSYASMRISLGKITENIIPPLKVMGQTEGLTRSIQAEVLEFVATGEEEALQELSEQASELATLLEQRETIVFDNQGETMTLTSLFLIMQEVSALGQEIIQSHSQTLAHLEDLEEIENEAEAGSGNGCGS